MPLLLLLLLLLLPTAARAFTRLTPKVRDIVFVATIKILLKPLVQKVPGFGEWRECCHTPPRPSNTTHRTSHASQDYRGSSCAQPWLPTVHHRLHSCANDSRMCVYVYNRPLAVDLPLQLLRRWP
jgi:hypothetical protein